MDKTDNVKFCAAAVIDLLDFSSHLEVGGSDLRTTVGAEAIERLEYLREAQHLIDAERKKRPDYYSDSFGMIRINDALILTIDLPDFLKPSIGDIVKRGTSLGEFDEYFNMDKYYDDDEEGEARFLADYEKKRIETSRDLTKFVGLVARVHSFISKKENEQIYPGPRTVVCSGFRRPLKNEDKLDHLSANFAFSNAYTAERHLHGTKLFVDTNILEMISSDKFSRNVIRKASFERSRVPKAYLNPKWEFDSTPSSLVQREEIKVSLFRKTYHFLELDSSRVEYLQSVAHLYTVLKGEEEPHEDKKRFTKWILNIYLDESSNPDRLGFSGHGLESDIAWLEQIVRTGTSDADKERLEEIKKNPFYHLPMEE
ncbi:MAG: hypothetical protein WD267_06545 [Balneolales bacterium]